MISLHNEILVNWIFIKRWWTHVLDFGPWKWGVLDTGFVEKWPSRIQDVLYFLKLDVTNNKLWLRSCLVLNSCGVLWVVGPCPYLGMYPSHQMFVGGVLTSVFTYYTTWITCYLPRNNDWGQPAISFRWTGWVWEITGWNSRLKENYWSF